MLLRFGVANHLSIRDYQELFLSASSRAGRQGFTIPVPTLKEAAVPVVALYGANAAGKSNLVDAMDELQRAVVRSHATFGAEGAIPRYPFGLAKDHWERPTQLDCTFTLGPESESDQDSAMNENVYEYGFTYTTREFLSEWLYRTTRRERISTQVLFRRTTENGNVEVEVGSRLRGENRTIANLTRPNSLFLSAAAQNNHPQLSALYRYFAQRWSVRLNSGPMEEPRIAKSLASFKHISSLLQLVRQADLGVTSIGVEEVEPDEDDLDLARDIADLLSKRMERSDSGEIIQRQLIDQVHGLKRLSFVHSGEEGNTAEFSYGMQSKGTQTLISLLVPALNALSSGSLFVIDELDTSLHPDLARAFVSLFKRKDSNPFGAQLVFSTHDVALLSDKLLSPDEIWTVDKGSDGVSVITPLTEYKLRSRDDIERVYRQGRLGGVPSTDEFLLAWDSEENRRRP